MNLLKELRKDKTQAEVAKSLNITQSHYGYVENSNRIPSLTLAKKIADYFNKSIEEIFF